MPVDANRLWLYLQGGEGEVDTSQVWTEGVPPPASLQQRPPHSGQSYNNVPLTQVSLTTTSPTLRSVLQQRPPHSGQSYNNVPHTQVSLTTTSPTLRSVLQQRPPHSGQSYNNVPHTQVSLTTTSPTLRSVR